MSDNTLVPELHMTEETTQKLKAYLALLQKWQAKINLISSKTLDDAWSRHFEDSLQIIPFLPIGKEQTLFDIGSGAGFPGLVIAMARPDINVHLIESDQKKCVFLQNVSRETSAQNVTIHAERIESFSKKTLFIPDIITARALKSLPELLDYCLPWITQNQDITLIFHKGATYQDEIHTAENNGWAFDNTTHQSQTAPDAAILVLNNIHQKSV